MTIEEEGRIVGFMSLVKELISERMILDLIQVDKNFRGQGIGRILWEKAVEEVRLNGARELYVSACPSEETIDFSNILCNSYFTDGGPVVVFKKETKIVCIVMAVYLSLNMVMNFGSKSKKEKCIMTPLSFVAAVCFWITALV